jgi:asparagine synthase (glutamine-hydrolysing)
MCGIGAIIGINREANPFAATLIRDALHRRGPDANAITFSRDRRCALIHTRLSIIDLSPRANQPMCIRHVTVAFNGEIYNYQELREQLKGEGVKFKTQSDTEVICWLYIQYGITALAKLRGMFSIVLLDESTNTLFAVRDQNGIKPLYFSLASNEIIIASTVKAFQGVLKRVDISKQGLLDFETFGFVLEPNTIFEQIKSFPAGSVTKFNLTSGEIESQDVLEYREGEHLDDNNLSLVDCLDNSVESHLISDCPINFFLSAGLDSTILVDRARSFIGASNINTLTVGFEEYKGQASDETNWAQANSKALGVANEAFIFSDGEYDNLIEAYLCDMDQPTLDGFNTYLISYLAAQNNYKVSISGVGADEFFQGYPTFWQLQILMKLKKYFPFAQLGWRAIGKICLVFGLILKNEKLTKVRFFDLTLVDAYILRRSFNIPCQDISANRAIAYYRNYFESLIDGEGDITDALRKLESSIYMKNQLLRDADWTSMSHSHEIRTPFVDCSLISGLKELEKRTGTKLNKDSIKNLLSKAIDKQFLKRKKTGFSTPLKTKIEERYGIVFHSRREFSHFILQKYLTGWKV